MIAGFQSINDYGTYQLDENNPSLHMTAKGTRVLNDGFGFPTNSIVFDATAPIVLVRSTNHGDYSFGVSYTTAYNGTNWTTYISGHFNETVEYWIFDTAVPAAAGNFGLELFNGSGSRIYSSSVNPLNIAGIITGNYATLPGDYTYTSGRNYAALQTQYATHYERSSAGAGGFDEYIYTMTTAYSITNGVRLGNSEVSSIINGSMLSQDIATFLVIDVTDY